MAAIKSNSKIEQAIRMVESELDDLAEKQEELSDKGQVTFYLAQQISEKRSQLESMKNFLQKRPEAG